MNLNSNNQQENFIRFNHNKLFNINIPPSLNPIQNQNNQLEQKSQSLNKRIKDFNKLHKKNKEEQEKYELNRNIANFYKNPFLYMEYLAKNYFIQQAKTLENLEIKKEMIDNFKKLCYQIEDHIQKFTSNEEMKLKKLQKDVEKKLQGGNIPLNNDSVRVDNNNKNLDENKSNPDNNFISSPANLNDEELMRRIFGNVSYPQSPLDGLTTTGNAANFVMNKKDSNLNEDNLYLNALSCLKGDKMVAPKNKFIAVKDLNIKDINQKKIVDTQNMNDLKNKMKVEEKMEQNQENDKKIKNKIDNMKKKDKKNLEELISYSNNYIKKMEQYQKEKEILLEELKKKLNKDFEENTTKTALDKLSICEKKLNDVSLKYNNVPENKIYDWEKQKDSWEKEFRYTQNMVNDFLYGGTNVKMRNQERKVNKKIKAKNKRNFSAISYKNNRFANYNFK